MQNAIGVLNHFPILYFFSELEELIKVKENNRQLVSTFSLQNLCLQRILNNKENGASLLETLGKYLSCCYVENIPFKPPCFYSNVCNS
jgi:hypothetical protein